MPEVVFSSNQIDDTGGAACASALHANTNLTAVDFSTNDLRSSSCASLAVLVSRLERLDVRNTCLGDHVAAFQKPLLDPVCRLATLQMENAQLGLKGLEALMSGMACNTSVESLFIGENGIDARRVPIVAGLIIAHMSIYGNNH